MMRVYLEFPLMEHIGQSMALPDAQARHVGRVMRARVGQELFLFDGCGHEVRATVESVERRKVSVRLMESIQPIPESPLRMHLGQVVSKGDRMDYVIQKSTELGVEKITPLYSEFASVRMDSERESKKLEHWRGVAISACEQCGRATIPEILPHQSLTDWVDGREELLRWILHPGESAHNTSSLFENVSRETSTFSGALLIGPEGGFSEGEVVMAQRKGFNAHGLGPRILRTETAPVVALSLLQHAYGDI
ncbi:Ribosomal RNA small subunit methyltransferase E [Halomonadaceae bacterium LMG 33818]|uniref:16S rRNA (uracil(1498)-N(3))-methyltransferase n=1 Tax=Cernens ardua TaxID=3402176 RepID=UPI003EDC7978